MDLMALVSAVLRQWIAFVVVLVLSAAGAVAVGSVVPQTYEAHASFLLLGPSSYVDSDGNRVRINPYARAGGAGEGIAANTALVVLNSPQARLEAEEAGFEGDYTLTASPLGGAILDLGVTADRSVDALYWLDWMIQRVQQTVVDGQSEADAPDDSLVNATLLTRSPEADAVNGTRIRAVVVTFGAGALLSVVVALGLDALRRRRADRQRRLALDALAKDVAEQRRARKRKGRKSAAATAAAATTPAAEPAAAPEPGDRADATPAGTPNGRGGARADGATTDGGRDYFEDLESIPGAADVPAQQAQHDGDEAETVRSAGGSRR